MNLTGVNFCVQIPNAGGERGGRAWSGERRFYCSRGSRRWRFWHARPRPTPRPSLFTGGEQSFPVLVSGEYALDVFGASGGNATGGRGAEVSGDIFLTAGETLTLFVGGRGQSGAVNPLGGGGGGGAFVFLGTSVLAVAGGGGGGTPGFRRRSRTGRDRRRNGGQRLWRGGRRERERRRRGNQL